MMACLLQYDLGNRITNQRSRHRSLQPKQPPLPRVGESSDREQPDENRALLAPTGRVEYNLFTPGKRHTVLPLISVEEAELEWLQSMTNEGWPVLKSGFFERHVDFGSGLERVVPLRATTPPEAA